MTSPRDDDRDDEPVDYVQAELAAKRGWRRDFWALFVPQLVGVGTFIAMEGHWPGPVRVVVSLAVTAVAAAGVARMRRRRSDR